MQLLQKSDCRQNKRQSAPLGSDDGKVVFMINLKIEIVIDEEKVIEDGRFVPAELYDLIKNSYRRYGLTEIITKIPNKIVFGDADRDSDLCYMLLNTIDLQEFDWFTKYVTSCLFYNYYDHTVEDILVEAKKYDEMYNNPNKNSSSSKKRKKAASNKKKKKKYDYDFKVEILIDEEKVVADNKYDPAVMYEYIRNLFRRFNLKEIETEVPNHIVFTDNGNNRDMGALGSGALDLYEQEWFRRYSLGFYWYTRYRNGSVSKGNIFDELDNFEFKV